MSVALKTIEPGDWDAVRENQDIIQKNLRQPVPNARVLRTTNQSLANVTLTPIAFDAESWDVGNLWKPGQPTRLTAPITGLYAMGANAQISVNANNQRQLRFIKNGTDNFAVKNMMTLTDGNQPLMELTSMYRLAAGDYIEFYIYQNSGVALNAEAGGTYSISFWMYRISGYTNEGIA